jgi:hypothetical protein
VATLVARNTNEALVGSGGICVWRKSVVWSQAVGFVFVRLAEIWLQSPWRCFLHLIYFIQTFYKFCTFNAIFKDNIAINCINVKKRFIPVNFDGSYARLVLKINEVLGLKYTLGSNFKHVAAAENLGNGCTYSSYMCTRNQCTCEYTQMSFRHVNYFSTFLI